MTTILDDGSRNFLHPADVHGRFTNWRRLAALALIAVYGLLPWIPVNGHPAVFFDIAARRIHFFGLTFAFQDLWLGFFFLTGVGFSLFVITALFGRLWCGWACPQTVFMEHVFRRIERLIEGPHVEQRRLDKLGWNVREKQLKRGGKLLLFLGVAFIIAHVFLAYFVSLPGLWELMTHRPAENVGAFMFIVTATGIVFFNFAWFREQLCLIICPYGRLQSALIDDDTLVIGYDEKRGEPRGSPKNPSNGDCIDCLRCVAVCPTGIDIRQGLQIECIGCANCVDACDAVMDRLGRERGLVRYDSLNGLAGGRRRFLRPRLGLYLGMLAVGAAVMTVAFSQLQPGNLSVVRMQGSAYYVNEETGTLRNQFDIRVTNKEDEPVRYSLDIVVPEDVQAQSKGWREPVEVEPLGEEVRPLVVILDVADYPGKFPVTIRVTGEPQGFTMEREVQFLGPDPRFLREAIARRQREAQTARPGTGEPQP